MSIIKKAEQDLKWIVRRPLFELVIFVFGVSLLFFFVLETILFFFRGLS